MKSEFLLGTNVTLCRPYGHAAIAQFFRGHEPARAIEGIPSTCSRVVRRAATGFSSARAAWRIEMGVLFAEGAARVWGRLRWGWRATLVNLPAVGHAAISFLLDWFGQVVVWPSGEQ